MPPIQSNLYIHFVYNISTANANATEFSTFIRVYVKKILAFILHIKNEKKINTKILQRNIF